MNAREAAVLTPEQEAKIEAFRSTPEHRAWEDRLVNRLRAALETAQPYIAAKAARRRSVKHQAALRRYAARLIRTPKWADQAAIDAVYAEAKRLTRETGIEHHVDHEIPLQGRLVSGLHVAANLRVIPAVDNVRKGNRFE